VIGITPTRATNRTTSTVTNTTDNATNTSRRTRTVWASLVFSMAAVGALLWGLEGNSNAPTGGVTLTPLMARTGATSVEAVFRTDEALDTERWQSIVVHHSGSPFGTPESIEAEHRAMNLLGLGHHFLIGNGNGLGDGEIHVGERWLAQQPGAHAGGERADWHNQHAISICLVGNGDRRAPTQAQLARLVQLTRALAREVGVPAESVLLHNDIAGVTDPGRLFPEAAFREQLADLDAR